MRLKASPISIQVVNFPQLLYFMFKVYLSSNDRVVANDQQFLIDVTSESFA